MYTLQGQTRPTRHVRFLRHPTYTRRTLPAGSPHTWQTFMKSSTAMDRATAPEKKGSRHNPQHAGWPIRGSVPSFSPEAAIEAVGVKTSSVSNQLLGLPGPYHWHVIGTFNTCSRGSTHQSLTDTGGGYNLGSAGFSHTTPRPSQPVVSPFHLRARLVSGYPNQPLPTELKGDQALNLVSGSLHSTSTITYHLSIAWANDIPPRSG
jgi:hypothetical protein